MDKITYSKYHLTMKKHFAQSISDVDVAEILFAAIIYPVELENKIGEPYEFDKTVVSKMVSGKINIPKKLKEFASDSIVISEIYAYFQENVVPKISIGMESVPANELKTAIENDDNITDEIRNRLLDKANKGIYAEFFADVFLYALKVDNKTQSEQAKRIRTDRDKPLPVAAIPENIDKKEMPYIKAIYEAYGEKENIENFTESDFEDYPEHKENLNRQRRTYYAAETLRRYSRDAYNDEEQAFEEAKQETYDGIIDKWDMDYPNGYQRMSDVLAQASQINFNSVLLARETSWLTNNTKKGLCHVLVNENELKGWVKKK